MKPALTAIAGLIASSAVPALLLAAFAPLSGNLDVASFVGSFIVALPFTAAANILLGLPAFLLLRRLGAIRWWSVVLAGILLGILFALVLRMPSRFDWHDLVTVVPLAIVSALTFWLVWKLGQSNSHG